MSCSYYQSGLCRSCSWMDRPYPEQLREKQAGLAKQMEDWPGLDLQPPVDSPPFGARNRSKMVVSGQPGTLVLGIIRADGESQDLCACPLYSAAMTTVLEKVKAWLNGIGISPYDIRARTGELKYVLVTENHDRHYMLRLVLRSHGEIPHLRAELGALLNLEPDIKVVSVNLQPVAMAIIEGQEEIVLTEQTWLPQQLDALTLYQRPKGFFQTNSAIAGRLYATAAQWLSACRGQQLWDLFCGAGGFGLSCLGEDRFLTGIEIEEEAIHCAKRSAAEMGMAQRCRFLAQDITAIEFGDDLATPDIVIVNPPRRGLGAALCRQLLQWQPEHILYSSCNANTLVDDLRRLEGYTPIRAQLFDMFPHTGHYEVLCLLKHQP